MLYYLIRLITFKTINEQKKERTNKMEQELNVDELFGNNMDQFYNPQAVTDTTEKDKFKKPFIVKVGQNNEELVVRLLPNLLQKEIPFYTAYLHYGIQPFGLQCLKHTFEEKCYICETIDIAKPDLKSKEQFKELAKWFHKPIYYWPCLVAGKEAEGVKFFELNQSQLEHVTKKIKKKPNILHPIKGHNFIMTYKKPENGKAFGEKEVEIDLDQTAIFNGDIDKAKEILKTMPDFWKLYTKETYEKTKNDFLIGYQKLKEKKEADTNTEDYSTVSDTKGTVDKEVITNSANFIETSDDMLSKLFKDKE